jgi:F-type H+-transporting ATPase subunit a
MHSYQQTYNFLTQYKLILVLVANCLLGSPVALAQGSEGHEKQGHEKEETNFIFHHIGDAHEWHLVTMGHMHVTIPLPIILVSKNKGVEIFSSNRFWDAQHHRVSYKGYHINNHEKIVADDPTWRFYDLSITKNVASMLLSMFLLLTVGLVAAKRYKTNPYSTPRGLWGFLEMFICFIRDEVAIPNIGAHHYKSFMPYLLSVFFFIWLNNLMGLLPGAANVTGNISVTLVLALFTFIITIAHGNKHYWGHILRPPGVPIWLLPIMIPVELMGLLTKPISLMVRLFANITAGHIILLSIISLIFIFQTSWAGLISVPFGAFMFLLKLIVAFLQAYIFTLLSAIYFGMAVEETHE